MLTFNCQKRLIRILVLILVTLFCFTSCSSNTVKTSKDSGNQLLDDDDFDDGDDDNSSSDDDDDDDSTEYAEPFDPTQKGPYAVGVKTFIFVDESRDDYASRGKRTLLTEVWYPAPEWTRDYPRDTVDKFLRNWFDFIESLGKLLLPPEEVDNFSAERDCARGVPMHPAGPYPLILISHGNASIRIAHMSLGEYLASHGYIVVVPDHIGNAVFVTLPKRLVIYNPILMPFSFVDRMQDFWFLIDHLTALNQNDPEGFFTGMVDVENIGVAGHSYGAVTATEGTIFDERIDAAVEMAAFMVPIWREGFDASFMFMMGVEDKTMGDYNPAVRLIDFPLSPTPKFMISIDDGGHYTFTDACVLIPTLMGNGDGCGEGTRRFTGESFEYLDYDTSMAIVNTYVTAFFGYNLKGQNEMLDVLTHNLYPDEMDLAWKL